MNKLFNFDFHLEIRSIGTRTEIDSKYFSREDKIRT